MAEIERQAGATWRGDTETGSGELSAKSGKFAGVYYSFPSRFQHAAGSNPEEFLAAAHAACFTMVAAQELSTRGHPPQNIETVATVTLDEDDGEYRISKTTLKTTARVPGIDEGTFRNIAEIARDNCPVSQLLKPGLRDVVLDVRLA